MFSLYNFFYKCRLLLNKGYYVLQCVCQGIAVISHDHHHLEHLFTEHRHLITDHQHLSALISSTISAHSLLVRSTVHYPELHQCALTFQLSFDPPATPRLRLPWFPLSFIPTRDIPISFQLRPIELFHSPGYLPAICSSRSASIPPVNKPISLTPCLLPVCCDRRPDQHR